MRFRLLWLSLFCLAAAVPRPARAAVLLHLSFEEMTEQSSAVFLGRCVEVRSAWSAEASTIVTHNVFEAREYYKGNLGTRVVITELGGQVGNLVAEYPGVPRFAVGEEALLFVWTGPSGTHQVIGLTQGKFRVRRDSKTGEILLRQVSSEEPMVEPAAHSHRQPVEQLAFPLSGFRSRVGLALQKRQGGVQ